MYVVSLSDCIPSSGVVFRLRMIKLCGIHNLNGYLILFFVRTNDTEIVVAVKFVYVISMV